LIGVACESTVVAEFVPDPGVARGIPVRERTREDAHQAAPGAGLRVPADHLEADLVANLRAQLEALNKITFTDAEWQRFFTTASPAQ
jgi:type I restriction enzyme R subunit